jgi:hypothetical protein
MALDFIIISISTYETDAIPGHVVEGLVILWEGETSLTGLSDTEVTGQAHWGRRNKRGT